MTTLIDRIEADSIYSNTAVSFMEQSQVLEIMIILCYEKIPILAWNKMNAIIACQHWNFSLRYTIIPSHLYIA